MVYVFIKIVSCISPEGTLVFTVQWSSRVSVGLLCTIQLIGSTRQNIVLSIRELITVIAVALA